MINPLKDNDMEQDNNLKELYEMRKQVDLLKAKLDKEKIVNQKMIDQSMIQETE